MLLLFDFDGVLADTLQNLLDIFIETQRSLGEGRLPTVGDFASLEVQSFGGIAEFIGIPDHMISLFETGAAERLNKSEAIVKLFPEIPPILKTLSLKHDICIITLNPTLYVTETLTTYRLMSTIAKIYGAETLLSKAENIIMAQTDFGADADTTYFIGDALSDILQAKQAGVKAVAALWGFQDRNMLLRESPDIVANHPNDLLEIFG
jgi:phosphoglycolate phosphatase-like HAD superfamily hydrolase